MLNTRNLMLALCMSFVFGGGWIFAKSAMEQFPPILLAGFRFGIAGLVLVGFVGLPCGRMKILIPISSLVISVPYSMSYTAMKTLDVSSAVLLAQMEAPILMLLGFVILGEGLRFQQVVGIAFAFLGVLVIAGDPRGSKDYLAEGLALGSVIVWALGQIRIRKLGDIGGLQNLAWLALLSAPQLFTLSLLLETGQLRSIHTASIIDWLEVLYLSLIMTVVGMGIWYRLIGVLPLGRLAPFLLLVPALSIAGGVIILGENLRLAQIIGGVAIIIGVFASFASTVRRKTSSPVDVREYGQ